MMLPSGTGGVTPLSVRNLRLIWIAFLAACLFYGVVALMLSSSRSPGPRPIAAVPSLKYLFYAVGGIFFSVSLLLKRRLGSGSGQDAQTAFRGTLTAMVAGLAVMEAVPILGIVLVALGGALADAVPLIVGGAIGVLLLRPDLSAIEGQVGGR